MPILREDKSVFIDAEKLKDLIKDRAGMTQIEFAAEIGRSNKYITNMHGKTNIPHYVFNVICKRLEVDADCLIWKDPCSTGESAGIAVVAAIENLSDKLDLIYDQNKMTQKMITMLHEAIEKNVCLDESNKTQKTLLRKVNANTVQLEKIKESVLSMSETEYDRAKKFLQDALSEDGRIEGTLLLAKADAACIKRSELMKARKDLNIQIKTVGYGKNQNAWWIKG